MNAQRTRWWEYALAIILGLLAGIGIAVIESHMTVSLTGAPWPVPVIMVIIAFIVLYCAWQVHRYATTEPRKRVGMKRIDPQRAVYTLVFAKTLAIAGALLLGWYGGEIIMTLGHLDATYYRSIAIQCAFAAAASLFDMIIGIVSEGLCQLPPTEGPEHPKMKERRQQQGDRIAGAAGTAVRSAQSWLGSGCGTRTIASCTIAATSVPSCR